MDRSKLSNLHTSLSNIFYRSWTEPFLLFGDAIVPITMVPVMVVNVDIETVATHESPTDGLDCNNDTSAHGFTLTCCLANRSLMEFI
ncbi:Core trichothecene cluster (CTC) protein 14 [Fusarium oxysporum f. sp. albedinis]|nr:Core trichothecene cluster (CTC) protein 14 [Fusarium oxysporum f. sp. albedinis]